MPKRWVGIVVSGEKVTLVDVEVPKVGQLVLQSDQSWRLQTGNRPEAYDVMYRRVKDYVREQKIALTVIKASGVGQHRVGKAHLDSAELRGAVMCAAASEAPVQLWSKAVASRSLSRKGKRKVDEYVQDESHFATNIDGQLKAGSREAALMLLAVRDG